MSFFHLLRVMNFNWKRAKQVFDNLTDYQIVWINSAARLANLEAEENSKHRNETYQDKNILRKSYDLRDNRG